MLDLNVKYTGGLSELKEFLCKLLHCHQPAGFDFKIGQPQPKDTHMHLDLQIDTTQKINVAVTNPGDAPPVWAVDSGDSTILVAADALSADLISSDVPSVTTYSVKGSRGGVLISDSITLTVVAAPPGQDFGLVAGQPVPKN